MLKRDLLGEEMWECNPAEAKKVWYGNVDNRWRIMTPAEVDAHLLDGPEAIAEWIRKKKIKPGEYI